SPVEVTSGGGLGNLRPPSAELAPSGQRREASCDVPWIGAPASVHSRGCGPSACSCGPSARMRTLHVGSPLVEPGHWARAPGPSRDSVAGGPGRNRPDARLLLADVAHALAGLGEGHLALDAAEHLPRAKAVVQQRIHVVIEPVVRAELLHEDPAVRAEADAQRGGLAA